MSVIRDISCFMRMEFSWYQSSSSLEAKNKMQDAPIQDEEAGKLWLNAGGLAAISEVNISALRFYEDKKSDLECLDLR